MNSSPGHDRRFFGLGAFALVVVLSAIFFVASRPAVDPDYGWHIANGRHVTDGVLFAGRDIYSWTAPGARWIPYEWLTEAVMSAAHDVGGPTLNSIFAALLVTVAFALVAIRLRKRGYKWTSTLTTTWLAFLSSIMSLGVRPQVLELVYLACALLFIDAWFRGGAMPGLLYATVALGSALWANTHGSFPLLPAILFALGAALWTSGDRRWLSAAVAALLALIMPLADPWGRELYSFASQSITNQTILQNIEEWQRPNLFSGSLIPFVAELVLIVCAIPAAVRQILVFRWPSQNLSIPHDAERGLILGDVFITVPIAILGLKSGRHVMLAGICGAPLIAWSIERALLFIKSRVSSFAVPPASMKSRADARSREVINALAAGAVAVALIIQAWQIVSPQAQRAAILGRYPVAVVAYLEKMHPPDVRLLNRYDWGGFIIERGRLKVFIDGRAEVYGEKQLARYGSIIHLEPGWDRALDSLGVNFVVMDPDTPLVGALRAKGWSEIARDSVGTLLKSPGRATFFRSQPNPQL